MSLIPEKAIPEDMQVIHLIAARLDTFHADMQDIKATQKEMVTTFSRLVLMEERQINSSAAIDRCFKQQEKLEHKIEAYEQAHREFFQAVERKNYPDEYRTGTPTFESRRNAR